LLISLPNERILAIFVIMLNYLHKTKFIMLALILMGCEGMTTRKIAIIDYVPEGVSIVFKISDNPNPKASLEAFLSDIKNNSLLSAFASTTPYSSISEKAAFLNYLNPVSSSLICLSISNDSSVDITFITKANKNLILLESIQDKAVETIKIDDKVTQRITINSQVTYTASKDSILIASSSKQIIDDILNEKTEKSPDFKKIFNLNNSNDIRAIFRNNPLIGPNSQAVNFASWTALNVATLTDGIKATGVSLAGGTIPQLLSIFEGQVPQQNEIARAVPSDALSAYSFTFSDAQKLQSKLKIIMGDAVPQSFPELFESVNEVGEIILTSGSAIVLKSIDPSLTQESLAKYTSEKSSFHDVELDSFSESNLFINVFSPLIHKTRPIIVFQLDDFFYFTESEVTAEQIITAYKNNDCLDKSYYENYVDQLSSTSSLLFFKMQGVIPLTLNGFLGFKTASEIDEISINKYPFAVLQYNYDHDFAHVNFISKETSKKMKPVENISEVFSLKRLKISLKFLA